MVRAVHIVQTTKAGRPFRWESTRATKDFAWESGAAVANGKPGSVMVGSLGVLASVPLAVVAAPYDLIAAPFRHKTNVQFEVKGRIVDAAGAPAKSATLSAESVGYHGSGQEDEANQVFRTEYIGKTDDEGNFAMTAEGSFGPNDQFTFRLKMVEPASDVETLFFVKKSKNIRILANSRHEKWRLVPAEPAPAKQL